MNNYLVECKTNMGFVHVFFVVSETGDEKEIKNKLKESKMVQEWGFYKEIDITKLSDVVYLGLKKYE